MILVFFLTVVFVRLEALLCITAMIMKSTALCTKDYSSGKRRGPASKVIDLLRELMFRSPYILLGQLFNVNGFRSPLVAYKGESGKREQ